MRVHEPAHIGTHNQGEFSGAHGPPPPAPSIRANDEPLVRERPWRRNNLRLTGDSTRLSQRLDYRDRHGGRRNRRRCRTIQLAREIRCALRICIRRSWRRIAHGGIEPAVPSERDPIGCRLNPRLLEPLLDPLVMPDRDVVRCRTIECTAKRRARVHPPRHLAKLISPELSVTARRRPIGRIFQLMDRLERRPTHRRTGRTCTQDQRRHDPGQESCCTPRCLLDVCLHGKNGPRRQASVHPLPSGKITHSWEPSPPCKMQ